MNTTDTPHIVLAQQTALMQSMQVSAFVLLSYDHVITFAREIRFIWSWPLPVLSITFLLNRYFGVVANVFEFYPYFTPLPLSPQSCASVGKIRIACIIMSQIGIWGSQLWRVSALYGHSKTFLWKILLAFGIPLSFDMWVLGVSMTRTVLSQPVYIGCTALLQPPSTYGAGATWVVFSLWEAAIVCLISNQTWGPATTIKAITGQSLLSTVLFRDGLIYFLVMAVAFLTNSLTYFVNSPYLVPGALSWIAACIGVTMTSRFILNLKEHLNSGVNGDGYTSLDMNLSNIVFRQLGNMEQDHEEQQS